MSTHFWLDFATPFSVGDQVYVLHPPKGIPCTGGPAWVPYQKGTIGQLKLVFDMKPGDGLVITQPTEQKTLHVDRVVYTILCSPSDHHQSAFTVECPTQSDGERRLFASEEEINAYIDAVMA